MTNDAANRVLLPCKLSRDAKGQYIPGRGDAGWTMYEFPSLQARAQFMAAHEHCAMPCWKRIPRG
jgi:hypothetical protein